MNALTPERLSTLLSLLQHLFGSDVVLGDCSVGNQRDDYVVLLAHLKSPEVDVVIKLAGTDAPVPCPFEQTAWVHDLVSRQTSVPVARIIAVDTSYARWPWRYMIKEYIPGVEWASLQSQLSREQAKDTYVQVAQAVAELHGVNFARFGDLPAGDTVRQTSDFVEALRERARRRIGSKRRFELFEQILYERAALFLSVTNSCLCHEDLHKFNIIFRQDGDGWRLANILDFDSAWAGCYESDLARLEMWNGDMAQTIMQSYGAAHPVAADYLARRPVYQLLWCLEYASETERHLADTARVCAELGIPPVESFAEEL
jgi:aminoglycoside phosphotransferase (APT) family kinase protein